MNEKTKLFRNFIIFSLFSYLFLISCRKDLLENETGIQFGVKPKFKIEMEHSEFLYLKNKNLDKMVNYTKFQNKNKKLVSPIYNFEIDEHLVQIIDHEDYTTYTFQIIRANPTENKIENYMVKMNGNNIIAHNLVSYPFQIINNEKKINYNATTIISLENPDWMPQNKSAGCPPGVVQFIDNIESFSVPVMVRCSGAGNHTPNDPSCNCGTTDPSCSPGYESMNTITVISWSCGFSGGGGNGDNNGGGSNQTITTPFINPESTPCDELKKVSDKPQFTANMNVLKNNINGTKEKGFIIRDKVGADAFSQVVEGNSETIPFPYAENTPEELDKTYRSFGTAHNHLATNPEHIGIFTPDDLGNLFLNGMIETDIQNPYKTTLPKKSVIFLITNEGFFALKINDLNKLRNFCVLYGSWTKTQAEDYFKKTFQNPEEYNIRPNSTHDQIVTGFLRFIQDQDIGIDLYEGDSNTFGSFNKLELNENNGSFSFTPQPCNN